MASWFDSPQHLKGIQKIKEMSPEDKAVTQTLVNELSGLYAGADMRKQLTAMRTAAGVKQGKRRADLTQQRLDYAGELGRQQLSTARKQFDYAKDELDTATNLGWGNIAVSGLSGLQNMRQKNKYADMYQSLMERAYPDRR